MSDQKRDRHVTVWLTEDELRALDQACERVVRQVPGARLSRGAYLAELLKKHLAASKDAS